MQHQQQYFACLVFVAILIGALLLLWNQWSHEIISFATSVSSSASVSSSLSSSDEALLLLPQVACVIYTYHGNRELITETYESWGRYCQDFDAFSDEVYQYVPGKKTIPLRAYPGPKDQLIKDVRNMWQYLADRYDNHTLHADFVAFSGDDAFWIMPALKKYLSRFTSHYYDDGGGGGSSSGDEEGGRGEMRLLLGGVDSNRRGSQFPWVGGAGYLVSRQLIVERVLQQCPERWGSDEDVFTSACLYAHGVNFTDTTDSLRRPRFCRDKPGNPCDGFEAVEPSNEVVLFHYTKGDVRKALTYKYYGNTTTTFTVSSSSSSSSSSPSSSSFSENS